MIASEKLSFTRKIKRLARVAEELGADKRELTGALLHAWSAATCPRLAGPSLPHRRDLASHPEVLNFVEALRSVDFLNATYWLSSGYAMWGDAGYRKQLAMFFTPPSITWRLLEDLSEQGVDFATHTFYDPACGGAAFLAPIALRMRDALRAEGKRAKTIIRSLQERLLGSDVDETLCELSRHFLRMVLAEEIFRTNRTPQFKVRKADSLTAATAHYGRVDVVVCNPPYRKMPADEVALHRDRYGDVIDAQPNLYGLFIALSIRLLKVGGIAGLVTPTSYLSGQYFSSLRTYILSNAEVRRIGMVSDRKGVYIDVEQETALTVLRRTPAHDSVASTTQVSVVAADGQYQGVGLSALPNSGTTWPIPRTIGDEELLRKLTEATSRISDYGYAIRSGSFVWNRDKRTTFVDEFSAARAGAKTAVPLLWSRDVKDGVLAFERLRSDDGDHRFVDLGSKQHPYIVRRPSVLLQRVTSNDQPRRLVGAAVSTEFVKRYGGFVSENHTVVLERIDDDSLLTPSELASLLATSTVDRYFRCLSGSTNVSVFELNQMALPQPALIRNNLDAGLSMEDAVRRAFDL